MARRYRRGDDILRWQTHGGRHAALPGTAASHTRYNVVAESNTFERLPEYPPAARRYTSSVGVRAASYTTSRRVVAIRHVSSLCRQLR